MFKYFVIDTILLETGHSQVFPLKERVKFIIFLKLQITGIKLRLDLKVGCFFGSMHQAF